MSEENQSLLHEEVKSNARSSNEVTDTHATTPETGLNSLEPVASVKSIDLVEEPNTEGPSSEEPILLKYRAACQSGDLKTVRELVENGIVDVLHDYDENDKITGLHWAAINNRLSIVKFLVSQGANVNALNDGAHAAPIHWAAKYGFVYIVDYLLRNGADATLVDSQGFNILHLATLSSNIMLVLYLLFFTVDLNETININAVDNEGRTALLWAAYQGDFYSVEALLKFNASVNIVDQQGFNPLHWAMVKGQSNVLEKLIECGSDFQAKTNNDKDVFLIAKEMKTEDALTAAFRKNGLDSQGFSIKKYIKDTKTAKLLTFFTPFLYLGTVFKTCGSWNYFGGLFLVAVPLFFVLYKILVKFVLPSYMNVAGLSKKATLRNIAMRSPLFSGILGGSIFWGIYLHLTRVLFYGEDLGVFYFLVSFVFIYVLLPYLFITVATLDPGYVEPHGDNDAVREVITELLSQGSYNSKTFCLNSWIHKPLRSRYSYVTKKLTLRFDHYCSWVYNEIGLNNHKYFNFFLIVLEISIFLMLRGSVGYFEYLEDTYRSDCIGLLGDDELCAAYKNDRFMLFMVIWFVLQAVWVTPLLAMQIFWTFKGCTTFEFEENQKRKKSFGIKTSSEKDFEIFETAPRDEFNRTNFDEIEFEDGNNTQMGTTGINVLNKPEYLQRVENMCCVGACFKMLGISNFFRIFSNKRSFSSTYVPTDYGYKTNFIDFWLTADVSAPIWQRFCKLSHNKYTALLNNKPVDYSKLYEYPERQSGEV